MKNKPVTSAFKRKKFYYRNAAEAIRIQNAAHTLGFKWLPHTKAGIERENISLIGEGYIYVNENCRMTWGGSAQAANQHFMTLSIDQLEDTAVEFKAWRKQEHKASKKRAKLRKWHRTSTLHTGNERPSDVKYEDVVTCLLRNGEFYTASRSRVGWTTTPTSERDVVAYKVHQRNVHRPEQEPKPSVEGIVVSFEDMVMGIVKDANGVEIVETPVERLDTNPKRQYGVSSIPLNMWSTLASAYGALGLYNGSLKYGKANFANTPVEASIYIAAGMRHFAAWAAGQEFDPADGVPNLGGVLANVAILLEARAAGTLIDDRLKMDGYLKEIESLKEIVKSLNVLHEGKSPKHYTLEDSK
jgi:hypothetical protein